MKRKRRKKGEEKLGGRRTNRGHAVWETHRSQEEKNEKQNTYHEGTRNHIHLHSSRSNKEGEKNPNQNNKRGKKLLPGLSLLSLVDMWRKRSDPC